MRSFITPLLLSLAAATPLVTENARSLSQLKQLECQVISVVVNALHGAPTATSFCSSLLKIPTATVSKTSTTTSTSVANTILSQTITATTVVTSVLSVTTGTTTLTADTVTQTTTAFVTVPGACGAIVKRTAKVISSATSNPASPASCGNAPPGLKQFACSQVSKACSCLAIPTPTTTVIVLSTASAVTVSTSIDLVTVPATITSTVTEAILATTFTTPTTVVTATVTSVTVPDTATDPNNCGACGNVCASGSCAKGLCTTPSCAGSSCSKYIYCGSSCVCGSLNNGGGLCIPGTTSCSSPACSIDSDCAANQLCVISTCCRGGGGICVTAASSCNNPATPKMLFARRPAGGNTVMG
ncbi:uncharacterized protein EKO05_0006842 [Ascochyta rabiei]|uniref:uncharacterized protein n=1 Tax=Didymella rabiei TaxID=5454 RepID=UPI0021FF94EA|nr:uncharacterized protein EKO05_0006842 [Ascochyta rabiei]UPX16443.1 hypothetical protein EKO05_0006842 [Ascochyta rabiei]